MKRREVLFFHELSDQTGIKKQTEMKRFFMLRYLFSKSRPKRSGIASQRGSALISVLISSAIGLIVIHGVTKSLVQSKLNQLILEKKERRRGALGYLTNILLNDSQACLETLGGNPLSGVKTDSVRSFEIPSIKDGSGAVLLDFTKDAEGNLTHAETKERLKNLGIDRFKNLKFEYKPAKASLGKVILSSETDIPGLHKKENQKIAIELSGLKVETDSADNKEKVTLCPNKTPLKILCGAAVTGSPHENGGGFVESGATAPPGAYIADTAVVCGTAKIAATAKVFGNAVLKDRAQVKDRAMVYGNAQVSGDAVIQDNARVYGIAQISGDAKIKDNAKVYDSAKVGGKAEITDSAEVYGQAQVKGEAVEIKDNAKVYDNAKVLNEAKVKNNAQVFGSAKIHHKAQIYNNAQVSDSAKVFDEAQVYNNAKMMDSSRASNKAKVYGNAEMRMTSSVLDRGRIYGNAKTWYSTYVDKNARLYGDMQLYGSYLAGNCRCSYDLQSGEKGVAFSGPGACSNNTCTPIHITMQNGAVVVRNR